MEIEFHQLKKKYAGLRISDGSRSTRLLASLCAHGQQQPVLVLAFRPERNRGRSARRDGVSGVHGTDCK